MAMPTQNPQRRPPMGGRPARAPRPVVQMPSLLAPAPAAPADDSALCAAFPGAEAMIKVINTRTASDEQLTAYETFISQVTRALPTWPPHVVDDVYWVVARCFARGKTSNVNMKVAALAAAACVSLLTKGPAPGNHGLSSLLDAAISVRVAAGTTKTVLDESARILWHVARAVGPASPIAALLRANADGTPARRVREYDLLAQLVRAFGVGGLPASALEGTLGEDPKAEVRAAAGRLREAVAAVREGAEPTGAEFTVEERVVPAPAPVVPKVEAPPPKVVRTENDGLGAHGALPEDDEPVWSLAGAPTAAPAQRPPPRTRPPPPPPPPARPELPRPAELDELAIVDVYPAAADVLALLKVERPQSDEQVSAYTKLSGALDKDLPSIKQADSVYALLAKIVLRSKNSKMNMKVASTALADLQRWTAVAPPSPAAQAALLPAAVSVHTAVGTTNTVLACATSLIQITCSTVGPASPIAALLRANADGTPARRVRLYDLLTQLINENGVGGLPADSLEELLKPAEEQRAEVRGAMQRVIEAAAAQRVETTRPPRKVRIEENIGHNEPKQVQQQQQQQAYAPPQPPAPAPAPAPVSAHSPTPPPAPPPAPPAPAHASPTPPPATPPPPPRPLTPSPPALPALPFLGLPTAPPITPIASRIRAPPSMPSPPPARTFAPATPAPARVAGLVRGSGIADAADMADALSSDPLAAAALVAALTTDHDSAVSALLLSGPGGVRRLDAVISSLAAIVDTMDAPDVPTAAAVAALAAALTADPTLSQCLSATGAASLLAVALTLAHHPILHSLSTVGGAAAAAAASVAEDALRTLTLLTGLVLPRPGRDANAKIRTVEPAIGVSIALAGLGRLCAALFAGGADVRGGNQLRAQGTLRRVTPVLVYAWPTLLYHVVGAARREPELAAAARTAAHALARLGEGARERSPLGAACTQTAAILTKLRGTVDPAAEEQFLELLNSVINIVKVN